ncbi:WcaF family extracellular polysaccharide biosynthesis acetyltransferase [uncultured Polaribacter sp.]|uniref:WcaF family extracellular polysaccharide biosynthesis acetyltransferase n=1 Tax=uncultured Polaribacter sp. TaxID=174711 RepID=UPI002605065C|nr:WcaF family extracellular polysaccharide biosynthesis acetyltransferase [uncultured Polaribacter sp.]
MGTDLSTFNNSSFQPGSLMKKIIWYFVNILFFMNPLIPISSLKVFILKLFGTRIGKGVVIKQNVNIKYPWLLEIGDYVWIGENVWVDNLGKVTIGDNVCISQGALLLCGNHNYKKSTFDLIVGEIHLEEGVWVGAKSVVCPDVTLKSHSILAVGSVANKDLEAYSIYQGNPAIRIRERNIES